MSLHILCLEWAYGHRTTNNVHNIYMRVLIYRCAPSEKKNTSEKVVLSTLLKETIQKNEGRVEWGK